MYTLLVRITTQHLQATKRLFSLRQEKYDVSPRLAQGVQSMVIAIPVSLVRRIIAEITFRIADLIVGLETSALFVLVF
jgi:hypothetical protein